MDRAAKMRVGIMTATLFSLIFTCIGVGVARSVKAESVVRLGLPPITHTATTARVPTPTIWTPLVHHY